jgi:thymidylate synthase (FAD)
MKVELIDYMGDDDSVVMAARVSFLKESSNYTQEQNIKLLNFLAAHNHWSPFSHPQLQFRITCPIYVERQLVKTEAGRVYNSISGRYVDFSDTYTTIKEWRKQSKDSKQGSDGLVDRQKDCNEIQDKVIEVCKMAYQQLLDFGVAKEQARTVLPLSLNTTMIYTCSLYTFIRLYKQRTKPDAQKEINDLLQLMMKEVVKSDSFQHSIKAFNL